MVGDEEIIGSAVLHVNKVSPQISDDKKKHDQWPKNQNLALYQPLENNSCSFTSAFYSHRNVSPVQVWPGNTQGKEFWETVPACPRWHSTMPSTFDASEKSWTIQAETNICSWVKIHPSVCLLISIIHCLFNLPIVEMLVSLKWLCLTLKHFHTNTTLRSQNWTRKYSLKRNLCQDSHPAHNCG